MRAGAAGENAWPFRRTWRARLGTFSSRTPGRIRSDIGAEPGAGTVVLKNDDVIIALMRPGAARPAGAHGAMASHRRTLSASADLVGDELRAGDHVREHVADDGGRGLIERLAVVLRRLAELAAQDIGRVAPEPRDDRGVKALDAVRPAVSTQGGERQLAQAAVIMSALDLEQQRARGRRALRAPRQTSG